MGRENNDFKDSCKQDFHNYFKQDYYNDSRQKSRQDSRQSHGQNFTQKSKIEKTPVIVTAYYKLNLAGQSSKSYKASRTTQTYLDFFSFFSKVQNTFIIYTDEGIEEQIYAMREKHVLRDKTIVIKKSLSFDAKALDSIRKVFRDYNQIRVVLTQSIHPPHKSRIQLFNVLQIVFHRRCNHKSAHKKAKFRADFMA